MAMGTPVVTLLGDKMRQRIVSGGYMQMHLEDPPIAKSIKDYIGITLKLANEEETRNQLKQSIKNLARKYLFNNEEVAKELTEFIHKSIACRMVTGTNLQGDWKTFEMEGL
jgi:predicted O-linked N-acetylglucosamine transferase (SPINDLY family)